MTKIMIASPMTEGQIENAVNKLRDALRKHRFEISSDAAQQTLGAQNLGMMMFAPFRKHAEAASNIFTRKVKMDGRSLKEVLDNTRREKHLNAEVLATAPEDKSSGMVEVVFFRLDPSSLNGGCISEVDLDKEFEIRGLRPADPRPLALVNEADPTFTDEKSNSTYWKDARGGCNFISFYRDRFDNSRPRHWQDRCVRVDSHKGVWVGENRWFAGMSK